jgi:hypothetical protein
MADDSDGIKSGSAFWFIIIGLSFSAFFYLGIWGFWNKNIQAIAISSIYMAAMAMSLLVSKGEILRLDINFKSSCLNWTIGFLIGTVVAAVGKMFAQGKGFTYALFAATSSSRSGLFAAVSAELPIFWTKFFDNIGVPAAEEIIFLIGLPVAIIWAMENIGEYYEFFQNKIFQFIAILAICTPFFGIYHVGEISDWVFIAAAMAFRTVLLTLYWTDREFDTFPFWKFVPALFLGWHMGHNINQDGLMNFIVVLQSEVFGWIVLALFAVFIIVALDKVLELIFVGQKDEDDSLWGKEEPL